MKFKNPYYRKVKGSLAMLVSCGYCKKDIASYQKLGKGGLLRMHLDRIVESEFDLLTEDRGLRCPFCGELLATRSKKKGEDQAYNMIRSSYNTRLNY